MKNVEQKRLFKLPPQLTIFQVPIKMSVGAFCMCAHYLCCTLRMLQKRCLESPFCTHKKGRSKHLLKWESPKLFLNQEPQLIIIA